MSLHWNCVTLDAQRLWVQLCSLLNRKATDCAWSGVWGVQCLFLSTVSGMVGACSGGADVLSPLLRKTLFLAADSPRSSS